MAAIDHRVERGPRAAAGAAVLRAAAALGGRLERGARPTRATGRPPTGAAGSTTGSSARPTASTAPARARGRSTSRTGSSPGRPSRPTTPRTAPTCPTTSRAAARAAPRSPGTSTRRCGPSTRTCAACCSSCTARRASGSATRSRPGRRSSTTPRRRAPTSRSAARAASCARRWDEAAELIAAAHVHTVTQLRARPDRRLLADPGDVDGLLRGRDPLPLADRRRLPLSFYDWYADLPPASPQIWGDQTDVPESADWWNSTYMMLWGSNIPQTRTPDAHFMTEARYKGQKVVVVSPDYAGHTKFADHWLPAERRHRRRAGDGDGPRDPQGVLRRPPGRRTSATTRKPLHRHAVPGHAARARGRRSSPTASCAPPTSATRGENAEWKTVVLDAATGEPVVPNGSIGFRWGEEGEGRWNLDLGDVDPALTLLGAHDELGRGRPAALRGRRRPRAAATMRRGVPARRVGGQLVTTVFDLLCAQLRRRARRPAGRLAERLRRRRPPYTPAWQEAITGVDAGLVHADRARVRRQRRAHRAAAR